jgi:hypothetical protein
MTRAATALIGNSFHKDRHMNRTHSLRLHKTTLALAAAAFGCSFAPGAQALDFSSDGVELRVDSRLTVGAAWRVSGRDPDRIGISNGGNSYSTNNDDGDLAFDKGDLVASPIKLTSDATLTYGNYGFFVRGSYLYDPTLQQKKYFNPANYGQPGKEASAEEYHEKTDAVRDRLGHDGSLLDAYFYGSNRIFDRTLTYKIGRQILNWGESTLVQNGLNSLVSADANKLRVPGFDINEVVKPVGMVSASYDLIDNVSLEAFYQFEWRRTDPDAAGSFFETNDFVGVGGSRANISFAIPGENDIGSTVPHTGNDNLGKDSGQFGGALHFYIPQLNGIDLALYAAKYNSRLPVISGHSATEPLKPFGGDYFLEYPDDIKMFGTSFNATLPWGLALQGEYSLKVGQPLQIDDVEILLTGLGIPSQLDRTLGGASGNQYLKGYRRKDVSQVDMALTRVFGPSNWLKNDQTILVAEFAYDYIHDLPPTSELRFDAPGTYLPGYDAATDGAVRAGFLHNRGKINPADPDGRDDLPAESNSYATSASYGYKLIARLSYNNAIGAVALNPTIRFDHDLHGYTPQPIGNFVEGRKLISVSVGWTYHAAWSGDIGYVNYFGGGDQNLLSDRDYVEASVGYSF